MTRLSFVDLLVFSMGVWYTINHWWAVVNRKYTVLSAVGLLCALMVVFGTIGIVIT